MTNVLLLCEGPDSSASESGMDMEVDVVPPTSPAESPPVVTLPVEDVEDVEPTNVVACTPAAGICSAASPSAPAAVHPLSLHRHEGAVQTVHNVQ